MGCSSKVFTHVLHCFTSFFIDELVVVVFQNCKINWWSPSSRASYILFRGNPPQVLSLVTSTCILVITTLPKRYLIPPMVLDMKRWKGPTPFEIIVVKSAFLKGKFSFVCKLSTTYMKLWGFQAGPTCVHCF